MKSLSPSERVAMPFRSKAQQGYLWANNPKVAQEFANATPSSAYKNLPRHVRKQTRKSTRSRRSGRK